MKDKFYNSKEKLFLIGLFFAALVSLLFFINFRTLAFPEHNIRFDITREQASDRAKYFVQSQNLDLSGFKEATVFSIDDTQKTYLERELGVPATAKLAENDVAVWNFTTRFYKPLAKQGVTVSHLPNGRLVSYFYEVEEAKPGARLSETQAEEKARAFLKNTIKTDISEWKLVNKEQVERPKRIDHTFTWEKNGFRAKDATYRMEVHVFGDQIGGYLEYLKIPEAWTRAYEKETSNNDLAQTVAETLMLLLFGLPILITFITQYRKNNLRLDALRIFAVSAGIISILAALNSIPLALSGYPTTVSWEAFIASVVLLSILGGFFEGSLVYLVLAAGEAKFREAFPKMQSLESSIRQALFTKSVNKALFIGVFVGIIFFAYEVLFYFLGKQVGFWAPADTNYSDIFSTVLPWIYPMFIGFLAAASEEGIFRLFGIPFVKKYVKSTWAAIIITSIIWAFLHSNYPQSPWFVRGIEISAVGIVLGWLFVRYGFIASFTAHYTFNALQTAIYFYGSGNWYASISSTLASLLPLLLSIGLLGWAMYKKGFAAEKTEYLNTHVPIEKPESKEKETKVQELKYHKLTRKRKSILLALSLLSLGGLWLYYPQTSLQQVPNSLGRNEVMKIADETLQKRGVTVDDYKKVATFHPEDITMEEEYIMEVENFDTLRKIYPEKLPLAYWSVRYFKPLQKEEFVVDILPDGKVNQVDRVLDEKAPGANLQEDIARQKAEEYLTSEKGYQLQELKLVENKAEKREKRTDHRFVYEEKGTRIGEAVVRNEVLIKGDEVSGFDRFLKLPENWVREKMETTTLDFAIGGLVGLFAVIVLGLGLKTFLTMFREKRMNFRLSYKIAAVVTIFSLIATLNSLTTFYTNYDTAIPVSTYIIQSVLSIILGLILGFFMFAVVFGMFFALWQKYVGQIIPTKVEERIEYVKDALISGYSVPLILTGLSTVLVYFLLKNDLLDSVATFDTFPQLDTFLPFVTVLSEIPMAVGGLCFLTISALVVRKYFKSWKRVLLIMIFIALATALPQNRTTEDIVTAVIQNLLIVLGLVLIITLILRRNMLAYAVMLYISLVFASGWVLFVQNNMFFKINGIILLVFALLPLLAFFFYKARLR